VLLGISWGGKLAAAFARYRPDLLAAFGMLCPGLFAAQQAGWLGRTMLRIAGGAGLRGLHVPIPLQDPALFTASPHWQEYVRTDPLTLREVTISFALADLELNRYAGEAPEEIAVPALLMLAGRDRICDNRRTRDYFGRLGSADKTLREYADAAHTLEFEPDRASYFEDLRLWVEKVAGAT
jgi:alpha-beta hydrolase superfamily lysophospholipase